jgi:hypothetical protein
MAKAVGKAGSMAILMLAQVLVLSLWFISAATMPGMLAEVAISPARQAALSSGVQIGFVGGALVSAVLGLRIALTQGRFLQPALCWRRRPMRRCLCCRWAVIWR